MTSTKAKQISAFLEEVRSRLAPARYTDVAHYIAQEEYFLALRMLPSYLDERDSKLDDAEWNTYANLAQAVELDTSDYEFLRA